MSMICTYYKADGTRIGTYQELVDWITKQVGQNISDIPNLKDQLDKILDVIYDRESNDTTTIIKSITSKQIGDEQYYDPITQNTIIKGDALNLYEYINEEPTLQETVTPFSEEDLKIKVIENIKKNGSYSQIEAEELAQKQIDQSAQIKDLGGTLHKAIRTYFNSKNYTVQQLITDFGTSFSQQSAQQLIDGLNTLKAQMLKTHGNNCEFITSVYLNQQVELKGVNTQLGDLIDLIVVDDQQIPHIYHISTSSHSYAELIDVRERRLDYLLALKRHMLAAKGVNVENTSLNIIPIKLNDWNEGTINNLNVEKSVNRQLMSIGKDANNLAWGFGKYYLKVNNLIPLTLPKTNINTNAIDIISTNTAKFFPNKEVDQEVFKTTIEYTIKHAVVDSDNYTKGKFMIRYPDHNEYINTKSVSKYDSREVREAAESYVGKQSERSYGYIKHMENSLKDAISGKSDVKDMAPKSRATLRGAFSINFGMYCNSTWEILDREDLKAAGIIVLYNPISRQVDFIAIRSNGNEGYLNRTSKLPFGSNIAGCFARDEQMSSRENLLKYSPGNATLMQIMSVINADPNWLSSNNYKVGNIKVFNPITGETTIASNTQIRSSFSALCEKTDVQNNLEEISMLDDLEIFKSYTQSAFLQANLDSDIANAIFSDMEKVNVKHSKSVLNTLYKIEKLIRETYMSSSEKPEQLFNTSELQPWQLVYYQLCKAILHYEGVSFNQSHTLNKLTGGWLSDQFLNGSQISNPSTIPEVNLRKMVEVVEKSFFNMTQEITDNFEPFRNEAVQDLWNAKGFSANRNNIIGDQLQLYDNMFERNPDNGKLNGQLKLKDPWDPKADLRPEERKFLKEWLTRMNKLRFPTQKELDLAKETGIWLLIPLTEATSGSKLEQASKNPSEFAKKEYSDIKNHLKNTFKRNEDGVYNKEEESIQTEQQARYEIFNRFELSCPSATNKETIEDGLRHRESLLNDEEHDINFWERNLELLYSKFLYASIRKKHLDRALPVIRSLRIVGQVYGKQTQTEMKNFDKYIDDYLRSHVHNVSILDPEEKQFSAFVAPLKFMASTLALGFNVNTGIRNLVESTWKIPARISSKFYAPGDSFTKEEWMQAMQLLVMDSVDFTQNVTLFEALNQRFRIQDMDANRIAEKIASYKSGLTHTSDRLLFWMSTAPDYFNRMSMVLAQMIHDGSLQACSFTKEGFKYDWKQDKRFSKYAIGDKSNIEEYNKQRSLYFMILRSYNDENEKQLREGDALPLPYTSKQILAMKHFSDSVFGYFDHEQKAMLERNAITSLFSQFKTYLTAGRTMWFLAPDNYNKGDITQAIDESSGKPMYLEIKKDSDTGEEYLSPTTNVTDIPMMVVGDSYMEGIWFTLRDLIIDTKNLGIKEAWSNIKNSPIKSGNIKLVAWHIAIGFILVAILKALQEAYKEYTKNDKITNGNCVAAVLRDQVTINMLKNLTGACQDANIFQSLGDVSINAEPASIGILTTLATSTGQTLFGDKTLEGWLNSNVGMYRSFKELSSGLNELYSA